MNGKRIGNYIKIKRQERGFTLEEFSAQVGVPSFVVEKWEDGVGIEVEYLLPIAKALNADADELLKGMDEITSQKPTIPPQEEPVLKAIPVKEEKGYYEKLNEKIGNADYTDYKTMPSGENGYSDGERKFGYVLCSIFIAIVACIYAFTFLNWATRDRQLTLENCEQFLEIDVVATSSFNPKEYEVRLSAKKDSYPIYHLTATVEIEFYYMFVGHGNEKQTILREVTFTADELLAKQTLTKTVDTATTGYFHRATVFVSVSGDM